jgi:integrase
MKTSFFSCFAKDLELFIRKKQAAGFHYYSVEYTLHQFDKFCMDCCISEPVITKGLVNEWLESFENCSAVTVAGRASVIRQFCLFLLSIGKDAYIPSHKPHGKRRQIHVLNDAEICALFERIDQYASEVKGVPFRRLAIEYRVLFRLLLCCGLRVSEARKLKKEDVDLQNGTLLIRISKDNKDRIVYLPDDLRVLMIHYSEQLKEEYNDCSVWFFPAREMDNLLSVGLIDRRFNIAWNATAFASVCPDKPTVHSLRHTFVVKRMNAWMEQDIPLRSMLPYLSKYLGHKSVEDTFYYYHQLDTAFKIVHNKDSKSKVIIPEVLAYEDILPE